jgi:single-strand DNA-binding protein
MSASNGFYMIGRVVQAPEVKTTQAGKKWAKLQLEVDVYKYDGTLNGTSIHNLTAFGKQSEVVEGIAQGDLIAVAGEIESRKWEKDGKVSYFTDLNIQSVNVLVSFSEAEDPTEPSGF